MIIIFLVAVLIVRNEFFGEQEVIYLNSSDGIVYSEGAIVPSEGTTITETNATESFIASSILNDTQEWLTNGTVTPNPQ